MPSSQGNRIVRLKSGDGQVFELEEKAVTTMSRTLRHNLEDIESSENGDTYLTITVHHATGKALAKIVEYSKFHVDANGEAIDSNKRKAWDETFIRKFKIHELIDLLNAVSYLDMTDPLEFGVEAAAEKIKDKTVEEVREIFGIKNDYTPAEEAELLRKYAWAFE